MRRISHDTLALVTGTVYAGLVTNLLLLVAALPLVLLLVTTDPARSWPLIAVAAPLAAPGAAAAFHVFRELGAGGPAPVRAFVRGVRQSGARALAIGAMASAVVTVLLVDVRMLAGSPVGVAVVPLLGVLVALTLAVTLHALVAVAEVPEARLAAVLRASAVYAVRRWYLTAVSLAILAAQAVLFSALPALGLGLTAAAALYLAWSNSRYALLPVLGRAEPATAEARPATAA